MPLKAARELSGDLIAFKPFAGVDQFTHAKALGAAADQSGESFLVLGENVRNGRLVLERRSGAVKVYAASDSCGSKTFGADTKYAKVTSAAQLLLAKGGFAEMFHFTAVRPSSGKTAYLQANRQNGQTYGVIWFTIDDAGLFSANVRWSSGVTTTLSTTALVAASAHHGLLVYDDVLGTLTLYIDGGSTLGGQTVAASPGVGLQPNQTSGIDWYFGVEWNPATPGVTADTHFDGALDSFTLFTLAASGSSFIATLLKHSAHQWQSPQHPAVVFHYDFDDSGTTVLADRSWHANNGVITGGCTNGAGVALSSNCANFVGVLESPVNSRFNVFVNAGRWFFEAIP